jgi:hypothetical protein
MYLEHYGLRCGRHRSVDLPQLGSQAPGVRAYADFSASDAHRIGVRLVKARQSLAAKGGKYA